MYEIVTSFLTDVDGAGSDRMRKNSYEGTNFDSDSRYWIVLIIINGRWSKHAEIEKASAR